MAAGIGIIGRNAHQAMDAGFGLQFAVGVVALDLEGAGLDAGLFAVMLIKHGDLELVLVGPAHVHAHQHGGPVLAFGAAGAGIDLQVAVIAIGFAGEKRFEFLLGHFDLQLGQGLLGFGDNGVIAFGFTKLDQAHIVFNGLLEAQDGGNAGVQILALAHHLLGFLRIVPEIGIFGFGVQLGELADG